MHLTATRSAPRLLVALLFTLAPGLATAGGAFLLKGGTMRLTDDTQTLGLVPSTLDETGSVLAINLEGRNRNGVAFGGEYIVYRHDFSSATTTTGETRTQTLQFLGKKYFIDGGPVHPYVGVGIGVGLTHVTHTAAGVSFSDEEFTLAMQALAGIELRFDNLSFLAEVKHLYHDIESGGNEYNPTATGLFVGMGFNW